MAALFLRFFFHQPHTGGAGDGQRKYNCFGVCGHTYGVKKAKQGMRQHALLGLFQIKFQLKPILKNTVHPFCILVQTALTQIRGRIKHAGAAGRTELPGHRGHTGGETGMFQRALRHQGAEMGMEGGDEVHHLVSTSLKSSPSWLDTTL